MANVTATVTAVNMTLSIPDDQLPSGADDQTAAEVPVAPVGSHNAVNVQEALESLNTADGEMAQDIQSLAATKANATDVASAFALKADAATTQAALDLKANGADLTAAVDGINAALGTKATAADVSALDDDVTALAIDVAGKAPLSHTHAVADVPGLAPWYLTAADVDANGVPLHDVGSDGMRAFVWPENDTLPGAIWDKDAGTWTKVRDLPF